VDTEPRIAIVGAGAAEAHGIDAPLSRAMVALVTGYEAGRDGDLQT